MACDITPAWVYTYEYAYRHMSGTGFHFRFGDTRTLTYLTNRMLNKARYNPVPSDLPVPMLERLGTRLGFTTAPYWLHRKETLVRATAGFNLRATSTTHIHMIEASVSVCVCLYFNTSDSGTYAIVKPPCMVIFLFSLASQTLLFPQHRSLPILACGAARGKEVASFPGLPTFSI